VSQSPAVEKNKKSELSTTWGSAPRNGYKLRAGACVNPRIQKNRRVDLVITGKRKKDELLDREKQLTYWKGQGVVQEEGRRMTLG